MSGQHRALPRWGMPAVAILTMLALLNPPLPWRTPATRLTLLLDDSASLGQEAAAASWAALLPSLEGMPAGSALTLIRFAAHPAVELSDVAPRQGLPDALPRRTPISPLGTDLAAALDLAPPGAPVLLVTDGRATLAGSADALARLERRVPDIAWWQRPPTLPPTWIGNLEAPARIPAETVLPVTLTLGTRRSAEVKLTLDLDQTPVLSRLISLDVGAPTSLELQLPAPDPGLHRLRARLGDLVLADAAPGGEHATTLVQVQGARSVLLMGKASRSLAAALVAGGWQVTVRAPDALLATDLDAAAVTLLDDVSATALSPPLLQRLADGVTARGMGLLVLGGRHSFAAGGYRTSTLERLLPVLSEPPRREPAATVLFALDSSGSMGQPLATGLSRLDAARAAAMAAATALASQDRIGLALFGADAELVLPPARYAHPETALATALGRTPVGGTRLAPLLDLAEVELTAAGGEAAARRLLVLISDGQLADAATLDLSARGRRLAAQDIELVVIGIGEPDRTAPLQVLADAAGGRFAQVDRAAELPRFVVTEVQSQRAPLARGPFAAYVQGKLPFPVPHGQPGDWPAVAGYQPTRLREGATAPVVSATGDPLLAWQRAGLGRVAVLTAGLGELAPAWRGWPRLPAVLGALLAWVAGDADDQSVTLRAQHDADGLGLVVDAIAPDGRYSMSTRLDWHLQDPSGRSRSGSRPPAAPGRFLLSMSARYNAELSIGEALAERALWHAPRQEWLPCAATDQALAALARLPRWTPADELPPSAWQPMASTPSQGTRAWLAGAALLLFLGLLVWERLVFSRGRTWWPGAARLHSLGGGKSA